MWLRWLVENGEHAWSSSSVLIRETSIERTGPHPVSPTLAMPKQRILLVRERDFHIHLHQLAGLLADHGHDVEVLNTANGESEPLYRSLIEQVRGRNIPCHLVNGRASWIERKLIAVAFRLRLMTKRGIITPYKVRESRRILADREPFDLVIAFDPPSLFLACTLFPHELEKVIEYSLEVSDETHLDFRSSRSERSFRYFERAMLPKIGALLIQDRFRAQVLLRHIRPVQRVKTIYFPVAVGGPGLRKAPRRPGATSARVLFFGGLWTEAFLKELVALTEAFRPGQVLAIRGGRGVVGLTPLPSSNLDISTTPIPFDQVNDVIASADIGLALYPKDEANSRCSAFAGEKVARYLQCGMPIIAFQSPDYAFLQAETGCCELVTSYAEVPAAVNRIADDYDRYSEAASTAFTRFYSHATTAPGLMRDLARIASATKAGPRVGAESR